MVAESRWNQSLTCLTDMQRWHECNMGRTRRLLKFKRIAIRTVVVITGHCLIGRHGSRLGTPYKDYCTSCQEEFLCIEEFHQKHGKVQREDDIVSEF